MEEQKRNIGESYNSSEGQENINIDHEDDSNILKEDIDNQQINIENREELVEPVVESDFEEDKDFFVEDINNSLREQQTNFENIDAKEEKLEEDEELLQHLDHTVEEEKSIVETEEFEEEVIIEEELNNTEEENKEEKKRAKRRKVIKWSVISFSSLLIIYLGVSIYFMNRFHFGATINTMSVAFKTVEEINEQMTEELNKYALEIEGQGGLKDEITAKEIELKYNSHDKVQDFKDNQNPFNWIVGVFNKRDLKLSEIATYDEVALKQCFNNLSFFNAANEIKPQNPTFKYTNNGYEVVKEVNGNVVKKDILYTQVVNAILNGETNLDLNKIDCYEKPKYTADSKEVIEAKNTLNKYVTSKITYTFGDRSEVLDGATINTWLKVDENLNVSMDKDKVKNYIDTLGNKYDTFGGTRDFKTSSGTIVKVSGGDYGWTIHRANEVESLITDITSGKTLTKEPKYYKKAVSRSSNDIGDTYVEVDLTKQYLWFYKNGNLIVKGNIVTGNVSSKHSTPQGTYTLDYKQKDAVLRGPGYAAPVTYWMPFNGGIGLHDATWRSTFGGNIYKTDGSHGCVNLPFSVAEKIFYNIESGTPVVCHY